MKILFNSFKEIFEDFNSAMYGGIRLYTREMIKYMDRCNIEYIGLSIDSKKEFLGKAKIRNKKRRNNLLVDLTTGLNVTKIIESPISDVDKYTAMPVFQVEQVLRGLKPHAILITGAYLKNWYLYKAAKNLKIPVIVFHHGLWFKEIEDIEYLKSTKRGENLIYFENDMKNASLNVFLNQFSLQKFEEKYGKFNTNKVAIVSLPFNQIYAKNLETQKNTDKNMHVGFVGRWDPVKAPELYLKLAKYIQQKYDSITFHAVTKITAHKKLKKFEKDFKKFVVVHDEMKPNMLKKFYNNIDVLLVPSRFDVSPTVVMEAALQNTPSIISPNVGWVSDYQNFHMDNYIDKFADYDKLKGKLDILSKNGVSKLFAKKILKHHSTDAVFKHIFQLVTALIK